MASTEIYDPVIGAFTPGPPLPSPRTAHVSVLLDDRVLVVGGTADAAALVLTTPVVGDPVLVADGYDAIVPTAAPRLVPIG